MENKFQAQLVEELHQLFPGCVVLINDPNHIQGFPDLLVLYRDMWAALECKRYKGAPLRPNQDYYIEMLDNMSIARFIYPENKEEILDELQYAFGSGGETFIP